MDTPQHDDELTRARAAREAQDAAERQRRWRERQAAGLEIWSVPVRVDAVAALLMDLGRIPPDCADRAVCARALGDLIAEMAGAHENSVTRYGKWLRDQ